ncbi:allantoin racemase [Jannaschia faecimaris]|uniref:Allantoin racemase n=1 Tax=Jannaschia faecimaris TaxID=1244108 RepID=A0A1H3P7E9_9RHOB|nr:aspartate/glutamate racemase family protein [Jannaschia faecimaris]SDY97017.1 allantoin racemase [Jannaschia faecimaris]
MIVLINPNSTESMTTEMVATATELGVSVEGWTSHGGPAAIQGPDDGKACVPPLLKLVQKASDSGATAIIIGCFDDTGLGPAREIADCPVIGVGQAAYHMAILAGRRFSVVTTLKVSVPVLTQNIQAYGFDRHLGRVRSSGVPVLALEADPVGAGAKVIAEIDRAAAEDAVDSVVLGCAGMVGIPDLYGKGRKIRLIDGVKSAVRIAAHLQTV